LITSWFTNLFVLASGNSGLKLSNGFIISLGCSCFFSFWGFSKFGITTCFWSFLFVTVSGFLVSTSFGFSVTSLLFSLIFEIYSLVLEIVLLILLIILFVFSLTDCLVSIFSSFGIPNTSVVSLIIVGFGLLISSFMLIGFILVFWISDLSSGLIGFLIPILFQVLL